MTALLGLRTRLRLARLYLSTDIRTEQGDLGEFLEAAFAGGVDMVQIRGQLRETDPDAELAALQVARRAAERHQGLVCVDSPRLAELIGGDVLHLSQTGGSAAVARRQLHPEAMLGRSTHTETQADEAVADAQVDYFCVGPVFASQTQTETDGLDLVRYASRLAPPGEVAATPWFAGGGITPDNLGAALAAGARRVWVARAITRAGDPQAAAQALSEQLRAAWQEDPRMRSYSFSAYR